MLYFGVLAKLLYIPSPYSTRKLAFKLTPTSLSILILCGAALSLRIELPNKILKTFLAIVGTKTE